MPPLGNDADPPLDTHPLEYRLLLIKPDGSDSQMGLKGNDMFDQSDAFSAAQRWADSMNMTAIVVSSPRLPPLVRDERAGISDRIAAQRERDEDERDREWTRVGARRPAQP